jgi:hypothetical protein
MKNKNSHSDATGNDFIAGIYNYCDRWCERCEFTDRCRTFAMEQEWTDEELDPKGESFVPKIKSIFAETRRMLIEKAEEMGVDPFSLSDEEFAEIRKREDAFIDGDELSTLSEKYWRAAQKLLDEPNTWLPTSLDDGSISEALSVLQWFMFFIPVKMKSGLHSLLDEAGYLEVGQALDPQSHANGTMKIGLIAIDRSILAWAALVNFDDENRVQPIIDLLERLRNGVETRYPLARDFVRPGFDEAVMVM